MRIKPLPIAKEAPIDKGFMTYLFGYGTEITIGIYTWLIEDTSQHILVDTGASGALIRSTGFPGIDFQSQEESLETIGLTPDDIDIVILTHLRKDHAGDMAKFKKAVFYVQKEELDYAQNPHPAQTGWFALPPKEAKLRIIDGDEFVIPGIKILKTPGHTPGTQSVMVDTTKGKVCLSGLCTIEENFYPADSLKKLGVTAIAPGIHINALQAYDSIHRLQQSADIIIAPHDIKYFEIASIP